MGWCGGTEIFDAVLDGVLWRIHEDEHEEVIEKLAKALWAGDWDCESDSQYWDRLEPIMIRLGMIDADD